MVELAGKLNLGYYIDGDGYEYIDDDGYHYKDVHVYLCKPFDYCLWETEYYGH